MPLRSSRAGAVTELRGGYLVRNPALHLLLRAIDRVRPPSRGLPPVALPAAPRVLLAINGHLGDAVILSALLLAVRQRIPGSRIGILLPSWSRAVLAEDERVEWVHVADHWKSSRAPVSLLDKIRRSRATRGAAVASMRAVGYDVAIDATAYFPNFARLLAEARIPVRVGFTSGGFGGWLSHPVAWRDDGRHVAERQLDLLDVVLPRAAGESEVRYSLPPASAETVTRVSALLRERGIAAGEYVVVHMGAGDARKHWHPDAWRAVVSAIAASGTRVVLTGRGPAEAEMNRSVAARQPHVVDLTDRLDWEELVALIERARLVVTVDTSAGHVAAAVGTPCVAIWHDTARADLWRPLGPDVEVLLPEATVASPESASREASAAHPVSIHRVLEAVMRVLGRPTSPAPDLLAPAVASGPVDRRSA